MKSLRLTTILFCLINALTGCEGYQQAVRDIGHDLGPITPRDLKHAAAWEDLLHKGSGYTKRQIVVVPESGITQITIYEVKAGESASVLRENMRDVAAKEPDRFGSIEVSINLRH